MIPLIDTLTTGELVAMRTELDDVIYQRQEADRKEVLKQIRAIAAGVGCTVEDLLDKSNPKPKPKRIVPREKRQPGIPKYHNPDNPSQTWTGKGAKPRWFIAAQIRGMTPEQLLIQ